MKKGPHDDAVERWLPLAYSAADRIARLRGQMYERDELRQDAITGLITLLARGGLEINPKNILMACKQEVFAGIRRRRPFSKDTMGGKYQWRLPLSISLFHKIGRNKDWELIRSVPSDSLSPVPFASEEQNERKNLTDAQFRVLELFFEQSMTAEQIAAACGLTMRAVRLLKSSGVESLLNKTPCGSPEVRAITFREDALDGFALWMEKNHLASQQTEEDAAEAERLELRKSLGQRCYRSRRPGTGRKGNRSTKYSRRRSRLASEGRCGHCGKPCAPYTECEERRAYRAAMMKRKRDERRAGRTDGTVVGAQPVNQ